ncbi:MAG: GNAT family N-acetyltransferase [Acidobacteriota bacterium]
MSVLRPATGRYLEQILQDTHPLWHDGLSVEAYRRHWEAQRRTAWGAEHLDRVALVRGNPPDDAGEVLASAKRYDFSMRLDGRIRRVLGIGAVFTPPRHRGRGAARELMERILEAAEAEGFEFALLFSEIGPAYYEQFDFVPVPRVASRIVVDGRGGGAPAMLVRAGEDRDIPAIAEMNALRAKAARLALDRSEDLIRFAIARRRLLAGLGPPGLRQVEFLVTEEGHQAVAYLVCTAEAGRWTIEEAGDRDPSGARLGAMLQVMTAREPALVPPDIVSWWPDALRPPQLRVEPTGPTPEVMMIRPLAGRALPLPPLQASDVAYWHADAF